MSRIPSSMAIGLAAVIVCAPAAAWTAAAQGPMPGVHVLVKAGPSGDAMAGAVSDNAGRFVIRIGEPGRYTLSTSCRPGPCGPHAVQASAAGKALKARPDMTFEITVQPGQAMVITGRVTNTSGGAEARRSRMSANEASASGALD